MYQFGSQISAWIGPQTSTQARDKLIYFGPYATGHQPVEPDKGPAGPVPTPEEPANGHLPNQKHRDPEDPDFDDAD